MHFDKKVESLMDKIENNDIAKTNEEKKDSIKKILKDLVTEYNSIKDDAKANYEYSGHLLHEIEKSYLKNDNIGTASKAFCKVSQDIIDTIIKYYIKYEKKLILIMDKFNCLNF